MSNPSLVYVADVAGAAATAPPVATDAHNSSGTEGENTGQSQEEEAAGNASREAAEDGADIALLESLGIEADTVAQTEGDFFSDGTYISIVDGWNQKLRSPAGKLSGLIPFIDLYTVFGERDIIYNEDTNKFSDIKNRLSAVKFIGERDPASADAATAAPKGLDSSGVSVNSKVARIAGDNLSQLSEDSFITERVMNSGDQETLSYKDYASFRGVAGVTDLAISRGGAGSYNIKYDVNITLPNPEVINEQYEYSKLLLLNSTFLILYGWNITDSDFHASHFPPALTPGNVNSVEIALDAANGGFWRASLMKLTNFSFSFDNVGHMIGKLTFLNSQGAYLSTISTNSIGQSIMSQLQKPSDSTARMLNRGDERQYQQSIWQSGVPWSPGQFSFEPGQANDAAERNAMQAALVNFYELRGGTAAVAEIWDHFNDEEATARFERIQAKIQGIRNATRLEIRSMNEVAFGVQPLGYGLRTMWEGPWAALVDYTRLTGTNTLIGTHAVASDDDPNAITWATAEDFMGDADVLDLLIGNNIDLDAPLTMLIEIQNDPIIPPLTEAQYVNLRFDMAAMEDPELIFIPPSGGVAPEDSPHAIQLALRRRHGRGRQVPRVTNSSAFGTLYDSALEDFITRERLADQATAVSSGGSYIETMPRFGFNLQSNIMGLFAAEDNPNYRNFFRPNGNQIGILDPETRHLIETTSVISVPVLRNEQVLKLFGEETRTLQEINADQSDDQLSSEIIVTYTFWNRYETDELDPLRMIDYNMASTEVKVAGSDERYGSGYYAGPDRPEGTDAWRRITLPPTTVLFTAAGGAAGRSTPLPLTDKNGVISVQPVIGTPAETTAWLVHGINSFEDTDNRFDAKKITILRNGWYIEEYRSNSDDEAGWIEKPAQFLGVDIESSMPWLNHYANRANEEDTPDWEKWLIEEINRRIGDVKFSLEQAIKGEKAALGMENLQQIRLQNTTYNVHMQPVFFMLGSILEALSFSINRKLKFKYATLPVGQSEGGFSMPLPSMDTSVAQELDAQIKQKELEIFRETGQDQSMDVRVGGSMTGRPEDEPDLLWIPGGALTLDEFNKKIEEAAETTSQFERDQKTWRDGFDDFYSFAVLPVVVARIGELGGTRHTGIGTGRWNSTYVVSSDGTRTNVDDQGAGTGKASALKEVYDRTFSDPGHFEIKQDNHHLSEHIMLYMDVRSIASVYAYKGLDPMTDRKYPNPIGKSWIRMGAELNNKINIWQAGGWSVAGKSPTLRQGSNTVGKYQDGTSNFADVKAGEDHTVTYYFEWPRGEKEKQLRTILEDIYNRFIKTRPTRDNPTPADVALFTHVDGPINGTAEDTQLDEAIETSKEAIQAETIRLQGIKNKKDDLNTLRLAKSTLNVKPQYANLELRTTFELPVALHEAKQILTAEPRAPAHNLLSKLLTAVTKVMPNIRLSKRTAGGDPSYVEIFVASLNIGGQVTEIFTEKNINRDPSLAGADEGLNPGEQVRDGEFAYEAVNFNEAGAASSNKVIVCNFGTGESLVETFGLSSKLDPNAFASYRLPAVIGGVRMNLNQITQERIGSVNDPYDILGDIKSILMEGTIPGKESLAALKILDIDEESGQVLQVNDNNLKRFLMVSNDTNEIESISTTLVQDLMAQNSAFYNKMIALQNQQFRLSNDQSMQNGRLVGNQFYGNVLSTFLRSATVTIHGICGINAFNLIYIKGLLNGVEGVYVVVSVNESIVTGAFTTTLECKLVEYYNNDEQTNPLAYRGSITLASLGEAARYAESLRIDDDVLQAFDQDGFEDLLTYANNPEGRFRNP